MKIFYILFSVLILCSVYSSAVEDDFSEFDTDFSNEESDKTDFIESLEPTSDPSAQSSDIHSNVDFPDDEFEISDDDSNDEQPQKFPTEPKGPDLKIAKVSPHLIFSWNNYQIELLIMLGLVIYMLNFTVGKTKNYKIAQTWFNVNQDLLKSNFLIVGDNGVDPPNTNTLNKEYEHVYSLWCTGRALIESVLIEIRLINRQCLISNIIRFFKPSNDNIMIKVVMDEAELDGIVFAVGKKKQIQQLMKDHIDLSTFCKDKRGTQHSSLPANMVYTTETSDATTGILTPRICSIIEEYKDNFEYLYVSDQYCGPKASNTTEEQSMVHVTQTENSIIFCFKINQKVEVTEEDMAKMKPLMEFVFFMIEKISRIRLTKLCKQKSDRNRRAIVEARLKSSHLLRQEAAQTRKDEKKRAVKERIMAEEDPEKAKRMAEREEKKERKKQPKVKMIKGK